MSGAVTAAVVGAAVVGTAASIYGSQKQAKATKSAAKAQADASNNALNQQKEEYNRANQQQADIESLLEQNDRGDGGGVTSLTGAEGLAGQEKNLGKGYSLLGG